MCVKKNKIKILILDYRYALVNIQFIINLFPELEYVTIGIEIEEIPAIAKYLFNSNKDKLQHLILLCITDIADICFKEFIIAVKSEK